MSDLNAVTDAAEPGPPRQLAFWTDLLQRAGRWICADAGARPAAPGVQRTSFYTEQLLAVVPTLALAISSITVEVQAGSGSDWTCAAARHWASAAISRCATSSPMGPIASLPIEGILGSAVLILLVLEATPRARPAACWSSSICYLGHVFIGPAYAGRFLPDARVAGADAGLSRSRYQRHRSARSCRSRC